MKLGIRRQGWEGPLEFMDQVCWEISKGNYMGQQHKGLKSDCKRTFRQLDNKLTPSWGLWPCLGKISQKRQGSACLCWKDGQDGPEDASAGPEKQAVVVQQALPQAPFEPCPLEALSVSTMTLKGSHRPCSQAKAMSSQTCPGQRQATTLLFKGFIKEQTSRPGRMAGTLILPAQEVQQLCPSPGWTC